MMKRRLLLSATLAALFAVFTAAPAFASLTQPKVVPGRVLVGITAYAGGSSGMGVELELGLAPGLALATEIFPAYGDVDLNLRWALGSNLALRGGFFSAGGVLHPKFGLLASVPFSGTTVGLINADALVGPYYLNLLMGLGVHTTLSNGLGIKGGMQFFSGEPNFASVVLGLDYRF